MKIKRIIAYIIDIFIVALISSIIFTLPIFEKESQEYTQFYENYTDKIITSGSADITKEESQELVYGMSKVTQSLNIINVGVIIIYFGVVAYISKGKTIGKKIFNLQIVSIEGKDLNPNKFMLRQILVSNLIPKILNIINTMFFIGETWNVLNNAIGYLNYILYLLMLGFVIFRDDERGMHDIITNTKIIEQSKKEK